MKLHALRLTKGMDLRKSIEDYQKLHHIHSGCIITCVGCVYEVGIRLADGVTKINLKDNYEIVSLTGTLSQDGVHLHIALSSKDMQTIGGHLTYGCLVNTTAEIVLMEIDEYEFTRSFDESTGYDELVIRSCEH